MQGRLYNCIVLAMAGNINSDKCRPGVAAWPFPIIRTAQDRPPSLSSKRACVTVKTPISQFRVLFIKSGECELKGNAQKLFQFRRELRGELFSSCRNPYALAV